MNRLIESVKVFFRWGFYTILVCLAVSYFFSFNEGFFVLLAGGLLTVLSSLMALFNDNTHHNLNDLGYEDEFETEYKDEFMEKVINDPTSIEHQTYYNE